MFRNKNILLFILICIAFWWLYSILSAPVKFTNLKKERSSLVIERLKQLKICQEMYLAAKGEYANNVDSLILVLKHSKIPILKLKNSGLGDTTFIKSFSYYSALDSLKALKINLDSIGLIPFSNKKKFEVIADVIDYNGKPTPVVQVGARWKDFMGDIDNSIYESIDKEYDPDKLLKFGDLTSPNLNGNW